VTAHHDFEGRLVAAPDAAGRLGVIDRGAGSAAGDGKRWGWPWLFVDRRVLDVGASMRVPGSPARAMLSLPLIRGLA
jgi:hypothetical protein